MSNHVLSDRVAAAMQRHGVTGDGAAWVSNACNPVSTGDNPGIPDGGGCRIATPRFLSEYTIRSPGGPNFPDGEYDACLLIPGGSNTVGIVGYGRPGTDFSDSLAVLATRTHSISSPSEWVGIVQEGAAGTPTNVYVRQPPRNYSSFRWASRFVTLEPVMSTLDDGGVITAATFVGRPTNVGFVEYAGHFRHEAAVFGDLDETRFTQFAPRTYTAPAKTGAYIPIPMRTGPAGLPVRRAFADGTTVSDGTGGSAAPVALSGTAIVDAVFALVQPESGAPYMWVKDAQYGRAQTPDPDPGPSFALGTSDMGFDGSGLTVVMCRSLKGPLRVRVGGTMEAVPTTASDEMPYMHAAPPLDASAVEAYAMLRDEMQYGYPASYNLLGGLAAVLPTLISGLGTLGRYAAPHMKALATQAARDVLKRVAAGTPPEHATLATVKTTVTPAPTKRRRRRVILPPGRKPLPGG